MKQFWRIVADLDLTQTRTLVLCKTGRILHILFHPECNFTRLTHSTHLFPLADTLTMVRRAKIWQIGLIFCQLARQFPSLTNLQELEEKARLSATLRSALHKDTSGCRAKTQELHQRIHDVTPDRNWTGNHLIMLTVWTINMSKAPHVCWARTFCSSYITSLSFLWTERWCTRNHRRRDEPRNLHS